jgi:hypothetical protein
MTTYLDANFLVRMYLELPGCEEAVELVKGRSGRRDWPFPITRLLRLEVVNAELKSLTLCSLLHALC